MKIFLSKTFKQLFVSILILATASGFAQTKSFTRQDTLRGSITPEREWWDLNFYHLNIRVNPEDSSLQGHNTIRYKVLTAGKLMQIDMQEPMKITNASQNGIALKMERDGNVYFINLAEEQIPGSYMEISLDFAGKPQVSARPPWSGGLSWKRDKNNNPFIVTTCQGDGASLWWPCKDHQYDEPDSVLMEITVPAALTDVSNGRLRSIKQNEDNTRTFSWFVSSPINNYCINLNIADYEHFEEKYQGESGMLDCNYYVLSYNLDKAKKYFAEVSRMFKALEYWFGPYPFYADGYKLVEVPYPGMEHQSSVTYGNDYTFGYKQTDESNTGWGMKFDFIIVHESAHEWFGNSITSKDIADMWIHEAFGAYSESLFLNYHYGKQACSDYVIGTRSKIRNDVPIIGPYDVNTEGSHDMYYKGANMLHTLRQIINNDEKFRSILRGLSSTFYHQIVTTSQIEDYISVQAGFDLKSFFNQYLRDTRIPLFEYRLKHNKMQYRWNNCVADFDMPVLVTINGNSLMLNPTQKWQTYKAKNIENVQTDRNLYITATKVQ